MRAQAESKFKLISEAYSSLQAGQFMDLIHFIEVLCPWFANGATQKQVSNSGIGTKVDLFLKKQCTSLPKNALQAALCVRVVRTGVPGAYSSSNKSLIKAPFLLQMLGTISLGGISATRAYQRQKEASPSVNPFLP